MKTHKIINLPAPTTNFELVTRSYADTLYSTGSEWGERRPKGDKDDYDRDEQGIRGPKGDKGDKLKVSKAFMV